MSKVEQIADQVRKLSPEELARFRAWYSQFDADAWDREIDQDVASGKLDQLAEKALRAHASGHTSAL
ncbi:MAG: hypothetical protein KGJ55_07715 [Gammaproteobacteria bacterium]|nr:hypothetical protein [Gammaproteobacteria bacterium]